MRWRIADILVLTLGAIALLASCVSISSNKYFWNDELYSWYLIADTSFSGMWSAFHDKINNTPPLYFVLGWIWAKGFGASELSLRLFSSVAFVAAMVLTWAFLRKAYSFWPTCIGTMAVLLSSEVVLMQNAEARMYGLFLALAAGAVYQFASLNGRDNYELKHLVWVAILHGALVNTHLFGPFYSGAMLLAYAVIDWQRGSFRRGIYAAIIVGWLSFLIYVPAFLVQSDAGIPRAWLPEPSVWDFFDVVGLASPYFANVVFLSVLVMCLVVIYLVRAGKARNHTVPPPRVWDRERGLLVMALALIAVPVLAFLISRKIKPVFWDRYLIPSILGYCICVAHLTSLYVDEHKLRWRAFLNRAHWREAGSALIVHVLLTGLLVALLLNPLRYASWYGETAPPGTYDEEFGHTQLPIVLQSSQRFLERIHYAPNPERYYFILDEEAAMPEESGAFGAQEHKHMEAFRRQYPELLGGQILESQEFLSRFDRFLVLDYADYDSECPGRVFGLAMARSWTQMHCPQWVELRLLDNAAYDVTLIDNFWDEAVLLVERQSSGVQGPPGQAAGADE